MHAVRASGRMRTHLRARLRAAWGLWSFLCACAGENTQAATDQVILLGLGNAPLRTRRSLKVHRVSLPGHIYVQDPGHHAPVYNKGTE